MTENLNETGEVADAGDFPIKAPRHPRYLPVKDAYTVQTHAPAGSGGHWEIQYAGGNLNSAARALVQAVRRNSPADATLHAQDGKFIAERINYWVSWQDEHGEWFQMAPPMQGLLGTQGWIKDHAHTNDGGPHSIRGKTAQRYSLHVQYYDGPLIGELTRAQALALDVPSSR